MGGLVGSETGAVIGWASFSLLSRRVACCSRTELRSASVRASSAAALGSLFSFVLLRVLVLRKESEELLRFHFWARALVASMMGWQRAVGERIGVHRWMEKRRLRSEVLLIVDCSGEELRSSLVGMERLWVGGEALLRTWTTMGNKEVKYPSQKGKGGVLRLVCGDGWSATKLSLDLV